MSKAQDIITLNDGRRIKAHVLEVTPTQIIYKKKRHPNGPDHTVMKTDVATVVFGAGSTTIYHRPEDIDKDEKDRGKVRGLYIAAALSGGGGVVTSNDPTYSVGGVVNGGINFFATPMLNQHFGIQFGIGGEGYGYRVNYNSENIYFAGQSNTYAQRYFDLPVRVLYLSNSRGKWGFYANAGIDVSILANATDDQNVIIGAYYRDIIVSPYGSCGVALRNEKASCIWMLGPYYKTSLTNIYSGEGVKYDAKPFMGTGNVGNFTTMGLTLTFMTNFGLTHITRNPDKLLRD